MKYGKVGSTLLKFVGCPVYQLIISYTFERKNDGHNKGLSAFLPPETIFGEANKGK